MVMFEADTLTDALEAIDSFVRSTITARDRAEVLREPQRLGPENVVAVGIGEKMEGGRSTGDLAAVVSVQVKESDHEKIETESLVPSEIAGLPTDVEQVGEYKIEQTLKAHRPLLAGVSVGLLGTGGAGTLGCYVRDSDERVLMLSNNHVLADENQGTPGDGIVQPGEYDGGQNPRDVVGSLEGFVPLDATGPNLVDAAVASIQKGIPIEHRVLNLTPIVGSRGPRSPGIQVRKSGRTTGVTEGEIRAFERVAFVGYSMGRLRFNNVLSIRPAPPHTVFSSPGDSGSVVVDEDGYVVGLHFAGSGIRSLSCRIETVESELGVRVIPHK